MSTNLSDDYDVQLAHAEMLRDLGRAGPEGLCLAAVKYPDGPRRISIVGATILPCCLYLWRLQGASVHVIDHLMPLKGRRKS